MEFVNVLAAAAASYAFGAIWYGTMSKPWLAASGVEVDENGKPANASNPTPYIISLIAAIIVAGMMRHIFQLAGIDTVSKGLVSGFGLGCFLVSPWIATNYAFSDRPRNLFLIDGTYATVGCTIMGLVLTLF